MSAPQPEPVAAEQARDVLADLMTFAPAGWGPPGMTRGGDYVRLSDVRAALASQSTPTVAAEKAREPIARLHVSMERHDMGQSLAPPPPPYKFARANALAIAETMPVGTYDLVLASQSTPPPESATPP